MRKSFLIVLILVLNGVIGISKSQNLPESPMLESAELMANSNSSQWSKFYYEPAAQSLFQTWGTVESSDYYVSEGNGLKVGYGILYGGEFVSDLNFDIPEGSKIKGINICWWGRSWYAGTGPKHTFLNLNTYVTERHDLASGDDRSNEDWHCKVLYSGMDKYLNKAQTSFGRDIYEILYGVWVPAAQVAEVGYIGVQALYEMQTPANLSLSGFEEADYLGNNEYRWNVSSEGGFIAGYIHNDGGLELNWNVQGGIQEWFTITPTSGTISSGGNQQVRIDVDKYNYNDTSRSLSDWVIFANNANLANNGSVNIIQSVPANLIVTNHPGGFNNKYEVPPIGEQFTISFRNDGEETLYWNANSSHSWIDLSQSDRTAGELEEGETEYIRVNIDKNTSIETYSGYVDLFNMTERAFRLYLVQDPVENNPAKLVLGTDGDQIISYEGGEKSVLVYNDGGETLHWHSDHSAHDWITVQPESGSVSPGSNQAVKIHASENPDSESRSDRVYFYNNQDSGNNDYVNVEQAAKPTDNIWTKKWGEISTSEQSYTLNLDINEDIHIRDQLLNESYYEDKINNISIQKNKNGNVTQVDELQEIVSVVSSFSNNLLFEKNKWDLGANNLIKQTDIDHSYIFYDNSNNQYPINSVFGMDSNGVQKIRNSILGFREGTDYYNNRYDQYKKIIRSMVYYHDESQISSAFSKYGEVIDKLKNLDIGGVHFAEEYMQIKVDNLALQAESAQVIINSAGDQINLDKYNNLFEKIGILKNTFDSGVVLNDIRKRQMLVYSFLTEETGQKIEALYQAIFSAPNNLQDIALRNAILDVRFDFWDKYNRPEKGDWRILLDEMATFEVATEFGTEMAKIWSTTATSKLFSYWVHGAGLKVYLVVAPFKAGFSLMNARDLMRGSIYSTNLHMILDNALRDNSINGLDDFETTQMRIFGYQLQSLSSYFSFNYVSEYLDNRYVTLGNWLRFTTINEYYLAKEYFKESASKSLSVFSNLNEPWYLVGSYWNQYENSFDHSWLLNKVNIDSQIQETISKPSPPSIQDFNDIISVTAGGAVSNLKRPVEYRFDWGNGVISEWTGNHRNYIYSSAGTYNVRAQARSKYNHQVISEWSEPTLHNFFDITYVATPPNPIGKLVAVVGEELGYSIPDADTNTYEYRFSWGDGFVTDWGSSSRNYVYNYSGEYLINVRSRLKGNPYSVSDWSSGLYLTIEEMDSQDPYISVIKSTFELTSSSGEFEIEVSNSGTGTLEWVADITEGEGWMDIVSGQSGVNSGTVIVSHTANPSDSPRSGNMSIHAEGVENSPIEIQITQEGADEVISSIEIVKPDALSMWFVYDTETIEWVSENLSGDIKLELWDYTNNKYLDIATVDVQDEIYQWYLSPDYFPEYVYDEFTVKIISADDESVYDESDQFLIMEDYDDYDFDFIDIYVFDEEGNSISDVKIQLIGDTTYEIYTNQSGFAWVSDPDYGVYLVIPSKNGYTFEPEEYELNYYGHLYDIDFIASEVKQAPMIYVDSEELEDPLYEGGTAVRIDIENTGTGNLSWDVSASDWIKIETTIEDESTGSGFIRLEVGPFLDQECGQNYRSGEIIITHNGENESPITIPVTQWALASGTPDLVAKSIAGPEELRAGDLISITFSYNNDGDLDASAGWRGAIHLSKDNETLDGNEFKIYEFVEEDRFCWDVPDKEVTVELELDDTIEPGTYNYALQLDIDNLIYEGNTSNNILFGGSVTITNATPEFVYTITSGWNLIGLPLAVETSSDIIEHNKAISGTLFAYDRNTGGYSVREEMEEGAGYWLRFTNGAEIEITGSMISELQMELNEGWNLIAGISAPVAVQSVEDPENIVIDNTWFAFQNGSYQSATEVEPGKGYWVRTTTSGTIRLELQTESDMIAGAAMLASKTIEAESGESIYQSFDQIHFIHERDTLQTLFFGKQLNNEVDLRKFSLPPVPPTGSFDARFENNKRLVQSRQAKLSVLTGDRPIEMHIMPPDFNDYVYLVNQYSRDQLIEEIVLEGESSLIVSDNGVDKVSVQKMTRDEYVDMTTPDQFSLDQNYPNPFNPTTTIQYSLPDQSPVRVEVYDIVGRRIAVLVDQVQQAGYYSITFDASNLASGVYFYRIYAGTFSDIRKLTVIK